MRYYRPVLVKVLIHHQRTDSSRCACGWGVLGASFAEHLADMYEASMIRYASMTMPPESAA
jgi:hypothetical protein